MSRQPLFPPARRHLASAIAGLVAAALGISTVLIAETATAPARAPTTTAASAPSTTPATTSLPGHTRPRPLRDLADTPSVLPTPGPINARIGSGPIDASANPGQRNGSPSGATPPSGQALTTTLPPPGDKVEVFKNNQWLPAQVLKREGNRVYISYDGEGGAGDEWVGPNRVRSK